MSNRWLNVPSPSDLFKYGPVSVAFMFIGLVFGFIGAFGEVSISNRRLLLGAFLFCFGAMSYFGGRAFDWDYTDGRIINWGALAASGIFLLLSLLSGYVLLSGHLPSWFPDWSTM